MRGNFSADWAFGIQGALENVVRRNFPKQLRLWPVLQCFDFEAYSLGDKYFVMLLKDKLSGIPSGPSTLQPFPHTDHPDLPLTSNNVAHWLRYLVETFTLRTEDIAMILPIHDSGKNDSAADYSLFTDNEKLLWDYQLQFGVMRQKSLIQEPIHDAPQQPANVTYNVYGTNSRVNINSPDSSVNVVTDAIPEVFDQLMAAIRNCASDDRDKEMLATSVEEMKRSHGTNSFMDRYREFRR